MKILITGGCGFVGSNLAIFLKKRIKNYDYLQSMYPFVYYTRPKKKVGMQEIWFQVIKNSLSGSYGNNWHEMCLLQT